MFYSAGFLQVFSATVEFWVLGGQLGACHQLKLFRDLLAIP